MTREQVATLVANLCRSGWTVDGEQISGPGGDMWLSVTKPWDGDLEDFRVRMLGRVERIKANGGDPSDTEQLAATLDGMCSTSLVAFFSNLANVFHSFAKRYNMRIEKYSQGNESWALVFRPPAGGVGKLELVFNDNASVTSWVAWWIDDHDAGCRRSRIEHGLKVPAQPEAVAGELDRLLQKLLAWPESSLAVSGTVSRNQPEADDWYPDLAL